MSMSSGPQARVVRPSQVPNPRETLDDSETRSSRRGTPSTPQVKPPVEKKSPPAGVLLPRTGLPALRYQWNCRRNHADRVPTPNLRDRIDALERELRFYVNREQITISFLNVKGGASKTTTAVNIGSVLAHVTDKVFFLMPATNNTSTSTTALNAGISPRETLTVSQYAERHAQLRTYRDVSKNVPTTQVGLRVLSEDSEETVSISQGFNREMFIHVADTLHDSVDGLLFDTGNDQIVPGSVVLEAVHRSDVLVFTATADKQTTLEKLETTIGTYMTDLRNERNVLEGRRFEDQIPTRDKAAQSVVVISGAKPGTKPDAFKPYTAKRGRRGEIVGSIGWEGKLLVVPRDQYMAREVVANVKKIERNTYLAYLEIAIAIYKQAMALRGTYHKFDPNADL